MKSLNEEQSQTIKDCESVHQIINEELAVEIILWAMYAIKQNPEITIQDAISYGVNEWVK